MLPYQLRKFFVCFFLAENIQGNLLWNKYKNFFFQRIIMQALKHINILLNKESYTCFQLGLPEVECIESAEEKNLGNEKL